MIKKAMLAGLFILMLVSSVYAQDTNMSETVVLEEDFTNAVIGGWPTGTDTSAGFSIVRTLDTGGYKWSFSGSNGAYAAYPLPAQMPSANLQTTISMILQLPFYTPSACAGIQLDKNGNDFYAFLLCNDQTWGLMQMKDNTWNEAISFHKVEDFFQGYDVTLKAELSGGWADFYLNDELLDTYNIGYNGGGAGLFAYPLSADATDITFSDVRIASSEASESTVSFADDVPADLARIIKTLQQKERIRDIGGTYVRLADFEQTLAMLGYDSYMNMNGSGEDVLIQSDIEWRSDYELPDLPNSGCGLIFRRADDGNYIEAYIAMDGNIYLNGYKNGQKVPLFTYNYGSWNLEGKATLTVVADSSKISVLYDQNLLGTIEDASWIMSGDLCSVIKSGTNYGYGTYCSYTNSQGYIFGK